MKVSDARFAFVLPSAALAEAAKKKPMKAIRIYPEAKGQPWWKAEKHIEIDFENGSGDQTNELAKTCLSCGKCCKNLNTHQIRIFMTVEEKLEAERAGHVVKVKEPPVNIDNENFYVLDVDENGDCSMLAENGCSLGEKKPLWCQMFYCEKLYGGEYEFEE